PPNRGTKSAADLGSVFAMERPLRVGRRSSLINTEKLVSPTWNANALGSARAQSARQNQACFRRAVHVASDRAVADTPHRLVDDMQGHKEPLAWLYRLAETILNGQVKLRGRKDSVKK